MTKINSTRHENNPHENNPYENLSGVMRGYIEGYYGRLLTWDEK